MFSIDYSDQGESHMKLYVGNFIYTTTESELKKLFATQGSVVNVRIITDHFTRQSKCFGFVEMMTTGEGNKAIDTLHGKKINNQHLVVKKARRI